MSILKHGSSSWASPCRGLCTATSLGDAVCRGCGRTAIEVIDWNSYSNTKKTEINQRLLTQKGIHMSLPDSKNESPAIDQANLRDRIAHLRNHKGMENIDGWAGLPEGFILGVIEELAQGYKAQHEAISLAETYLADGANLTTLRILRDAEKAYSVLHDSLED